MDGAPDGLAQLCPAGHVRGQAGRRVLPAPRRRQRHLVSRALHLWPPLSVAGRDARCAFSDRAALALCCAVLCCLPNSQQAAGRRVPHHQQVRARAGAARRRADPAAWRQAGWLRCAAPQRSVRCAVAASLPGTARAVGWRGGAVSCAQRGLVGAGRAVQAWQQDLGQGRGDSQHGPPGAQQGEGNGGGHGGTWSRGAVHGAWRAIPPVRPRGDWMPWASCLQPTARVSGVAFGVRLQLMPAPVVVTAGAGAGPRPRDPPPVPGRVGRR